MATEEKKRGAVTDPARRSKKGKKLASTPNPTEDAIVNPSAGHVRLVRIDNKKDVSEDCGPRVHLSKIGRAAQLKVSEDGLSVTGTKGYRTVRSTHGVMEGSCYEARGDWALSVRLGDEES
jgi:hypothetical protein